MKKNILAAVLGILLVGMITSCGAEKDVTTATEETVAESEQKEEEKEKESEEKVAEIEKQESIELEEAMDESMTSDESESGEEQTETSDVKEENHAETDQENGLPLYTSDESGTIEEAITFYLWDQYHFDQPQQEGGVNIPAYMIFKVEQTEDDYTKVYGDFNVYEYQLKDQILECTSGGEYPGVFYLRQNENGYEAESFDQFGDGSEYTKSLDRICGEDQELRDQYLKAGDAQNEEAVKQRKAFINQYVKDNNLDVTAYQDFGWDPVSLSE